MKKVLKIILSLFIIGSLCCEDDDTPVVIQEEHSEASIRVALNIPSDAKRVLILSHAAHMDWDWLNPFMYNANESGPQYTYGYFDHPNRGPGDDVLTTATHNLSDSSYYYSVCEMAFLQVFAADSTALFNQMKTRQNLRIVGGGITSPDNLLPNGEGFIRNYLVANNWLQQEGIPWSNQVWIPDDFGHDPQLPVMLQAIDAQGVGFARIPGACDAQNREFEEPKLVLLDSVNGGVDFLWMAADSSTAIAHWLQSHYNQGEDIQTPGGKDYNSPHDIVVCNKSVAPLDTMGHLQAYLNTNGPVSPTPYIYVHVSDDFMLPTQELVQIANKWNTDTIAGYPKTGVYVVVATFDHYVKLVNNHRDSLKTRTYNPLTTNATYHPFKPNPYWMGHYASRPELKILHNEAVRTLMAAETFQVVANTLVPPHSGQKQTQINNLIVAWDSLAPSTHHDYINGTSVNDVYLKEQLPLLKSALHQGDTLKASFVNTIVESLPASTTAIAVFNALGMDNQGVISYQPPGETEQFLNVSAPSMGYQINDLSTAKSGDGSLQSSTNGAGRFALSNGLLTATFSTDSASLLSVVDLTTNQNILSGVGNEVEVFADGGGLYRFGYEDAGCNFTSEQENWTILGVTTDTSQALQKSITVHKQLSLAGNAEVDTFSIVYALRQGENILRISTTGSLPEGYTAMVKFPLVDSIGSINAGTPYHWNTTTPMPFGDNPGFNSTMWATHDFVIPADASGNTLAAIYHSATPAWTSQGNMFYGVILRNTATSQCEGSSGTGQDWGTHTQEYALRIPTGLADPATGQPLREARQFNTPMFAVALPTSGGGTLPNNYSLASASDCAMITTAKWCYQDTDALILRTYQPSNTTISCTLSVSPDMGNCSTVSALEQPITIASVQAECDGSGNQYNLSLPRAVATFKFE